ncbi:MAG: hypothetical protein RSE41_06595 [Clostridia bacterium]
MDLSEEQIKTIANNIAFDIKTFIDSHVKEYEKFLKDEELKEKGENKFEENQSAY